MLAYNLHPIDSHMSLPLRLSGASRHSPRPSDRRPARAAPPVPLAHASFSNASALALALASAAAPSTVNDVRLLHHRQPRRLSRQFLSSPLCPLLIPA